MVTLTRYARPAPTLARSTIGKKILMAVSGILLVGFLVAHMLGNLKVFLGAEATDHYAQWLRQIGSPALPDTTFLWLQRAILTAAVIVHIWAATSLTRRARKARPIGYAHRRPVQGSYAARTMRWGGVIIFLFVVWHILDLTTRTVNPVADRAGVHAAIVADFGPDRWYVTAFYALAVITLGFHLRHGVYSALQTLGLANARRRRVSQAVAATLAAVVCAGFLSVPLAVTTGLVN